jgi:hypothetical protein
MQLKRTYRHLKIDTFSIDVHAAEGRIHLHGLFLTGGVLVHIDTAPAHPDRKRQTHHNGPDFPHRNNLSSDAVRIPECTGSRIHPPEILRAFTPQSQTRLAPKSSVARVPIFLRAGCEENARKEHGNDDRHNNKWGSDIHSKNSVA